jgi:hypothetical protein
MEVVHEYYMFWEFLAVPVYLGVILFFAYRIGESRRQEMPYYRYYLPGLVVKIFGGLVFTAIYTFYYPGGDCHAYYQGARSMNALAMDEPQVYFSIMAGNTTPENWSYFTEHTGYPPSYLYVKGGAHFAVSRYISPLLLPSLGSMIIATLLLNVIMYIGIWKFFRVLCLRYPGYIKRIALAVLFFPSVVFWSGGIMKDSFTYAATLYLTAAMYEIFIYKMRILRNIPGIILSVFLIVSLKPYIIIALLPCLGLIISYNYIIEIKNTIIRTIVSPVLILTGVLAGLFALSLLSTQLGTYSSVDNVVSKAQINQQDLMREEQYGSNNFNIGPLDPSIGGLARKFLPATIAGLFRPFLWEARNPVMVISAIENFLLLSLLLFLLFRLHPGKLFRMIGSDHYLLFAFIFSLIFSFSVGISTANFGALVRYKIPALPFFVSALLILYSKYKEMK